MTTLAWSTMSWPRSTQISPSVPLPFLKSPAQRFSMRGHLMPRHIEHLFTASPHWRLKNHPSGNTKFMFSATINRIHCLYLQWGGPTNFILDTHTLEERKLLLYHQLTPLPVEHVWLYAQPTMHTDLHMTMIILPFWQVSLGTGLPKYFLHDSQPQARPSSLASTSRTPAAATTQKQSKTPTVLFLWQMTQIQTPTVCCILSLHTPHL